MNMINVFLYERIWIAVANMKILILLLIWTYVKSSHKYDTNVIWFELIQIAVINVNNNNVIWYERTRIAVINVNNNVIWFEGILTVLSKIIIIQTGFKMSKKSMQKVW